MLQVDVENNRILFCAEGIPLYEPLLGDERSKTGNAGWGCFLLSVATFSTVAMIFFFAASPSNTCLDSLCSNGTNSTSHTFPFEVEGHFEWVDNAASAKFQTTEWMKRQKIGPSTMSTMSERFALAALFAATNGVQWKTTFEFLKKNISFCEWNDGHYGVFCDGNHSVKKLLLGE
jgi:hypothetical protein